MSSSYAKGRVVRVKADGCIVPGPHKLSRRWGEDDPCVYCGRRFPGRLNPSNKKHVKQMRSGDYMTYDHVIPKSQGGPKTDNLARACFHCNQKRGTKGLLLFLLELHHDPSVLR